jgi:hypothetical protein
MKQMMTVAERLRIVEEMLDKEELAAFLGSLRYRRGYAARKIWGHGTVSQSQLNLRCKTPLQARTDGH